MPGDKRGEVYAELRGELFGILDFIKAEETQREPGFILEANARRRNQKSSKPKADIIAGTKTSSSLVIVARRPVDHNLKGEEDK